MTSPAAIPLDSPPGAIHTAAPAEPSLWSLFREDYRAHGRDWTKPGFRAIAIYRFGVWRMGIRPRLFRAPFSLLYRFLFRYVRNHYGIELPYSARLGRRVIIEHQSAIVIHGNSVIGDDSIIRQGVTLGNRSLEEPRAAPVLGRGVNIGAGAKILGSVRIGDFAAIGANAVVLSDVPAGATAVGIPARICKKPAMASPVRAGEPTMPSPAAPLYPAQCEAAP